MNYYEIGQRIRKIRKARGFSQENLAEKVGISTTHMSHIETGNTKLSLAVLVSLSETLEVSADDFLYDITKANRNAVVNEIISELDGCTSQQIMIIKDIVKTVKTSMNKYI